MSNTKKSKKLLPLFFGAVIVAVTVIVIVQARFVRAFTGPTGSAGTGVGAIGVDASKNLSIGTSTTKSDTKLLIVGSSTAAAGFAIQVLDIQKGPLFVVTNDGRVTIGSTQFASGTVAAGSFGPQPSFGGLFVHGPMQTDLDLKANGIAVGTTTAQGGGNVFATGNITGNYVANNVTAGVFGAGNFAFQNSLGVGTTTQVGLPQPLSVYGGGYFSGNVGIGTTTPSQLLTVGNNNQFTVTSGGAVLALTSVNTPYITTTQSGYGKTIVSMTSAGANYGTIQVENNVVNGGTWSLGYQAAPSTVLGTPVLTWNGNGNVGIGTSTPQALLSVGNTTTSLVAIFGGGTGKITVGTVDPIYTIGGAKYATYSPETTGVKVETTGVISLKQIANGKLQTTIDFKNLEQGSDLWLFGKTTNLKNNFDKLTALLTAGFDGRVWYEKDASKNRLTIFAVPSTTRHPPLATYEVSYRLSAPRFDSASWPNTTSDPSDGFILDK